MKLKTTHIFVILAMSGVALFSILFFVKNSSVSLGLPVPTGKNTDAAHPHPHTRAQGDSPTKRAPMVSEDENVHGDVALTKATRDKALVAHTPPVEGIYQSFKTALDLNKTDPIRAQEEIHAIAEQLGNGDPDWTEYYHLIGHSLQAQALAETEKMYMPIEDALVFLKLRGKLFGETEELKAKIREVQATYDWNKDGEEVKRQAEPIQEVINWMEENADADGQIVVRAYLEKLNERALPKYPITDNWLTREERVDIRYQSFFEALELLPENSKTLEVLFDSYLETAESTLLSEQTSIKASPSPLETHTDTHTWDMVHETPDEEESLWQVPAELLSDTHENQNIDTVSTIAPDFFTALREDLETALEPPGTPERFNHAKSLLERFGVKEGLNRLKNDDPELAERLEKYRQRLQNER